MNRRRFIAAALGGAGLLALPAGYAATGFRRSAEGLLMRELGFLRHDPEGIDRFIDAYFANASAADRLRINVLYVLRRGPDESWTVEDMVNQYLLGSDFFRTGMDERRVVRFAALYSPHAGGCSNPFAETYHPRPT
jgi:hypothetical protein